MSKVKKRIGGMRKNALQKCLRMTTMQLREKFGLKGASEVLKVKTLIEKRIADFLPVEQERCTCKEDAGYDNIHPCQFSQEFSDGDDGVDCACCDYCTAQCALDI